MISRMVLLFALCLTLTPLFPGSGVSIYCAGGAHG